MILARSEVVTSPRTKSQSMPIIMFDESVFGL
jgi:hypothetical protein